MKLFGEVFDEPENYIDKSPSDAYIHKMLSKETFIAITAMYNKEVVGGLAAYVLDKFEQDRREIYIYDLAVSEKHRRKHIATNLIHLLREIAIEKDAYVIFVQADYVDEPAIKLYDSLGIREEVFAFLT